MKFENVKVGDKLAQFHFGNFQRTLEIVKVTKTWIFTDDGLKYSKKDGYQIGHVGRFSPPILIKITEVLEKELRHKELCLTLQSVRWSKVSLEDLEAIKAILDRSEESKDVK
jgi:hypothetical protein